MDIIPILSTVILIATIVTLIVAITSYVVFRVKERNKPSDSTSAQAFNSEETGSATGQTTPYLPGATGQMTPSATKPRAANGANLAPASHNNVAEDEFEEEYSEEDFEEEIEEEPEEELSAAQSAFMNSMRSAIGEQDKGHSGRRSAPPVDSKMRRFKISKKNDESIGNDEENGRSLWR